MKQIVASIQEAVSCALDAGDWITLIGVAIAASALWWQIRGLRRQLLIQTFADYTKRYQEIILNFPENINEPNFDMSSQKDVDKTMRYMRAYFDLCWEEFYLHENKLIDEKVWSTWKDGMHFAFSKEAFRQAWVKIKKDTHYATQFVKLVEDAQCRTNGSTGSPIKTAPGEP